MKNISRSRPSFGTGVERRGRARKTALALCAISALVSSPAPAQLLVDPLEVTLVTAGTSRVAATFTLTNSSDTPVQASITREDWDRLETGENRFLPPGSTGASCGKILSVSPVTIRVDPRSTRTVRLAVEGGETLSKECWDIFFVEEAPQRQAVRGNSLQYIFRTGVKVYVVPPGLRLDAAIEDMKVEAGPKRQIAIRFRNTGAMHLLAKGTLEFRRPDNSVALRVPIAEFPTLPGAARKVSIDVPPDLPAGDYVALALIDFGGAELIAGQIEYQAK